jgi:hypothetical protein
LEENNQGINVQLLDQSAGSGISKDLLDLINSDHSRESQFLQQQYFVGGLDSNSGSCSAAATTPLATVPANLISTDAY